MTSEFAVGWCEMKIHIIKQVSEIWHKVSLDSTLHGNPQPSFLGVITYNPYIGGLKPSFFMVLGSKG